MLSERNVAAGTAAVWEKAYVDNYDTLCSRARRKLTNGDSFKAEDTVTDAFVRLMRYVPNPIEIESPASYWWTTVKRVWAIQQAQPEVSKTVSLDALDEDEIESLAMFQVAPEVLAKLDTEAARRDLRLRLGPLSLDERDLIARRLQGYSFAEIAQQRGESIKRTRFCWHKLKARLRYRANKQKEMTQTRGAV